jgi:dihydrolipoamide dehydrogenase
VSASIKDKDRQGRSGTFRHCIVAIGIVPNTENIGLEALGVAMDRGFLKTDPYCRTNVPGLWAIGDITAPPWLAHKASHEGVTCAEAIAQELGNTGSIRTPMDARNIPGCTYCHPQVASVGLTEAKAREAGL